MVGSVQDIETLVAIGQRRGVAAVLREIMNPCDERHAWDLGSALRDFQRPDDRNPLLEEAWQRLSLGDLLG